jgi:hypothetical protein
MLNACRGRRKSHGPQPDVTRAPSATMIDRLLMAGQRPSAERLKSTLSSLAVTPCERMTKGVE